MLTWCSIGDVDFSRIHFKFCAIFTCRNQILNARRACSCQCINSASRFFLGIWELLEVKFCYYMTICAIFFSARLHWVWLIAPTHSWGCNALQRKLRLLTLSQVWQNSSQRICQVMHYLAQENRSQSLSMKVLIQEITHFHWWSQHWANHFSDNKVVLLRSGKSSKLVYM